MQFPDDLKALPTQPWDERPDTLPLTIEEARTALWLEQGNVARAAQRLKITPWRLRNYINSSPRLIAEQHEAREQLADRAEEIVKEALNDPIDPGRRDGMAKYVLSSIGKTRGFGSGPGKLSVNSQGGVVVIQWGDGTSVVDEDGEDGPIIEGEVVSEGDKHDSAA